MGYSGLVNRKELSCDTVKRDGGERMNVTMTHDPGFSWVYSNASYLFNGVMAS